jgi:hypothetical protein
VICWWGHWCLIGDDWRHHRLISWARELASSRISLPYELRVRKCSHYFKKSIGKKRKL